MIRFIHSIPTMLRRRQPRVQNQEPTIVNEELKKQRNVLTPLIIALSITFLLLLSSETEESDVVLPGVQKKQKEEFIHLPKEQAQLEVDQIVVQKSKLTIDHTNQFQLESDGPFTPDLHDSNSLVQHLWYRGEKFDGKTRPHFINTTFPLAIDAISVATETSLVTLQGQVNSWGSHHSIRYFFGATELDDADPTCAQNITLDDMQKVSEFCSGRAWRRSSPRVKFLRNRFARGDFMVRFRKTPGWMCAQKRFAHAVGKIGRFYRKELRQSQSGGSKFALPDYLLIHDDDTFYNMVKLYPFLIQKDPSRATADAGCLVRMPISEIAFDYPYGGFGLILSKASLEKWIRPINCKIPKVGDEWETRVCAQIKENLIGESVSWKNGMSITDVMEAHATSFPYVNYKNWQQPGYCIHGDWALGYFINYYGIAEQSKSFYKANEFTRIEQTLGYHYSKPEGNCMNEGQIQCTADAHVCHRLHGVSMKFVARLGTQKFPDHFRTVVKQKF